MRSRAGVDLAKQVPHMCKINVPAISTTQLGVLTAISANEFACIERPSIDLQVQCRTLHLHLHHQMSDLLVCDLSLQPLPLCTCALDCCLGRDQSLIWARLFCGDDACCSDHAWDQPVLGHAGCQQLGVLRDGLQINRARSNGT